MLVYVLRRLLYLVPVILGVSVIVFALVHLAPGDPISAVIPPDAPPELVQQLKAYYGFDQPLLLQYLRWLGQTLTGNFGTSISTGQPVAREVFRAFGNTMILAVSAMLLAFTLAIILGTIAADSTNSLVDRAVTSIALFGVSVPHYWLAIVLVIIFSVEYGLLPPVGMGPDDSAGWALDAKHLAYMVLPTIALSVIPLGIVTRSVRAAVRDVLGMEFVTTLRAKGMRDREILWHVMKNAAPTCLAVMGLQAGNLIGGSILIETVFSWPGTGFLLNTAIFRRDLPVLQGTTIVLALFFVLLNLAVDVLQTTIDPRIKRGRA